MMGGEDKRMTALSERGTDIYTRIIDVIHD